MGVAGEWNVGGASGRSEGVVGRRGWSGTYLPRHPEVLCSDLAPLEELLPRLVTECGPMRVHGDIQGVVDTVHHHDAMATGGLATPQPDLDLLHSHTLRNIQVGVPRVPVVLTLVGEEQG